jgi:hypothetical protein
VRHQAENVPDDNLHDFQQQSSRNLHSLSAKTELTVSTDLDGDGEDQFQDLNESRYVLLACACARCSVL